MKRKTIIFIVCAFLSVNAFSQLRFGLTAGLSLSDMKANDFTTSLADGGYHVETVKNTKVGLQGGLVAQIILGGFFLQPEFLLVYTGGDVKISDINSSHVQSQRFTKLDIPVLVGAKMGPLRLGAGPVASFILSKPSDAWDFSGANVKSKYNNATFGYQVGAGLDIFKFSVDLKYEGNLSKLGNAVNIGDHSYAFDSRNNQWILAVSLFF